MMPSTPGFDRLSQFSDSDAIALEAGAGDAGQEKGMT
jgi:hypothetical protein